ncbi:MAG: hypothetical protein WBA12_15165, partial [Catalinimonas sp.]
MRKYSALTGAIALGLLLATTHQAAAQVADKTGVQTYTSADSAGAARMAAPGPGDAPMNYTAGYAWIGTMHNLWGGFAHSSIPSLQRNEKYALLQHFTGNYTYVNANRDGNDGHVGIRIDNLDIARFNYNGNVGIGTINPLERLTVMGGMMRIGNQVNKTQANTRLSVDGTLTAKKVVVTQSGWADFVFADDYRLPPLAEVETFVKQHRHLPEVPSEAQVLAGGQDLGEM